MFTDERLAAMYTDDERQGARLDVEHLGNMRALMFAQAREIARPGGRVHGYPVAQQLLSSLVLASMNWRRIGAEYESADSYYCATIGRCDS